MRSKDLTRIALLAAVYAALTVGLSALSYGPFFQLRVAEALCVLPYLWWGAVPGLFVGCLVANVFGGLGLADVVLGSLATLAAAVLTRRMPRPWLAPLPPVVVNAVVVGSYLSVVAGAKIWVTMGWVALGQILACYGLGLPLLTVIRRNVAVSALLFGSDRRCHD